MNRLGAILSALSLVALIRCATSEDEPEHKVPGGYADATTDKGGSGGTKSDAKIDAPETGGSAGEPSDAAFDVEVEVDASLDAPDDVAPDAIEAASPDVIDSGAIDKLLLVGRTSAEVVLGEWDGATWQKKSIPFSGASIPAIATTSTGAVAVVRHAGDNELNFATWAPASGWSGLSAIGTAGWTISTPALAAAADVHLVFQGTDFKHYANRYQAGAWLGFGPVTASGVQSFGPSAPTASASGSDIVIAFEGDDHDLYTQTWSSGFQSAFPHGLQVKVATGVSPAIAERKSASDTVVVYVETGSKKLIWTAGKNSTWSSPTAIPSALGDERAALSGLSTGSVACAFRGTDQKIYVSTLAGTSFSAPVSIASGFPSTAPPSIASGIAGHDAEVALISGGAILVSSLAGGTWSNPVPVATNSQAAVAIARFAP